MGLRTAAKIAVAAAALLGANAAWAQSTCGDAQAQLQGYIARVNQIANYEYYQGIPARCRGNPQCAGYLLMQLNQWYAMQSSNVNGWYQQIASQCTGDRRPPRLDRGEVDNGGIDEIDEDAVDELEVEDEDQTVVIRIPDNPRGFRTPRR